jgi:hypothetical protein
MQCTEVHQVLNTCAPSASAAFSPRRVPPLRKSITIPLTNDTSPSASFLVRPSTQPHCHTTRSPHHFPRKPPTPQPTPKKHSHPSHRSLELAPSPRQKGRKSIGFEGWWQEEGKRTGMRHGRERKCVCGRHDGAVLFATFLGRW